jgi:hypothetical protein
MPMPSSQNAMQKNSSINVQWVLVDTPDSDQLVGQAVALILRELEQGSNPEGFDKIVRPGQAEGAPVESN